MSGAVSGSGTVTASMAWTLSATVPAGVAPGTVLVAVFATTSGLQGFPCAPVAAGAPTVACVGSTAGNALQGSTVAVVFGPGAVMLGMVRGPGAAQAAAVAVLPLLPPAPPPPALAAARAPVLAVTARAAGRSGRGSRRPAGGSRRSGGRERVAARRGAAVTRCANAMGPTIVAGVHGGRGRVGELGTARCAVVD
ncbi:MAG TPA: hypothetical protein VII06_38520 [Chloroflexota bacterium]